MHIWKRFKGRLARAKAVARRKKDYQEGHRRQEALFKMGDEALARKDTHLMRQTIQQIKLYNRSLLEAARRAKKTGNLEMYNKLHQGVLDGIRTIKNFQVEIQKIEN